MASNPPIVIHESQEANLLAAKQAIRKNIGSYFHRHTDMYDDVIDVVIGREIIERHICRKSSCVGRQISTREFKIEETALYL